MKNQHKSLQITGEST